MRLAVSPALRFGPHIDAREQTLRQLIPLAGTPWALVHDSGRSPAAARRSVRIPLTGARVPPALREIIVELDIDGHHLKEKLAPRSQLTAVVDVASLIPPDARPSALAVRVGYLYRRRWPASPETRWHESVHSLAGVAAAWPLMPGWTLSAEDRFDLASRVLHLGAGGERRIHARHVVTAADGSLAVPTGTDDFLDVFDSEGRHLAVVDGWTGAVRARFERNPDGTLAAVHEGGRTTLMESTPDGCAVVAPSGERTSLRWSAPAGPEGGSLEAQVDLPGGGQVRASLDTGVLVALVDPAGARFAYAFDADGRLVEARTPLAPVHRFVRRTENGRTVVRYESEGSPPLELAASGGADGTQELECCDGQWRTVERRQHGRREVIWSDGSSLRAADGGTTGDSHGTPADTAVSYRTPGGVEARYVVRRSREMATTFPPTVARSHEVAIGPSGSSTLGWEGGARRAVHRPPVGPETTYDIDADGRVAVIATAGLEPVRYEYDPAASSSRAVQGNLVVTRRHDAAGRIAAMDLGGLLAYEVERNDAGRTVAVRWAGGASPRYAYDLAGNVVAIEGAGVQRIDYAPGDVPSRHTSATGARTTYVHDGFGRVVGITLPSGRTIERHVEAPGLQRIAFPEASLSLESAAGASRVTFLRRDTDGSERRFTVERDGSLPTRLSWDADPATVVAYGYESDVRPSSIQFGDAPPLALEWHPASAAMSRIGPFTLQFAGPGGRPSEFGNGEVMVRWEHDARGFIAARQHTYKGNVFYRIDLERDVVGRVVGRREWVAGNERSVRYGYDAIGQLISEKVDGREPVMHRYDGFGNRVERVQQGAPADWWRYDADDRLVASSTRDVETDADGMLVRRGDWRLTHDAQGSLLAAHDNDGRAVRYAYDALGRLVGRESAGQVSSWVTGWPSRDWPTPSPLLAAGGRHEDPSSAFVYGPYGELLAVRRGDAWWPVATDQVGSPTVVVDPTGTVERVLEHDAFGARVSDSAASHWLPVGFAGGLADPDTGLVRFGLRDYDPWSARWTTRDPAGLAAADFALYRYCWNDPVNRRDMGGAESSGPGATGGAEAPFWTRVHDAPFSLLGGTPETPGLDIPAPGGSLAPPSYTFDLGGLRCTVEAGKPERFEPDAPFIPGTGKPFTFGDSDPGRLPEAPPGIGGMLPPVGVSFRIVF